MLLTKKQVEDQLKFLKDAKESFEKTKQYHQNMVDDCAKQISRANEMISDWEAEYADL